MKMNFTSENKSKSSFEFPRLYLEHGERARIVCIEEQPSVNFVHTLRAPAIVNGEAVMESVKGKDGAISERVKMDFVGKHLCFGNAQTLMEKGKDPEGCPTCAAAQQNDQIGAATRRFAMHVIKYAVNPGGFKVREPFSAELVVWSFSDRQFSGLIDIAEEHGDLRMKDLMLGPCENKNFQKFDVNVGGGAEWLKSDETKKFVTDLYANNKIEDLDVAIGRKISRDMAQEDISKVLLRHQQANGGGSSSAQVPDLAAPGAAAAAPTASLDLEGLLGGVSTEPTPLPESVSLDVEAAPEPPIVEMPAEAAPAAEDSTKTLDFDSLLKGL